MIPSIHEDASTLDDKIMLLAAYKINGSWALGRSSIIRILYEQTGQTVTEWRVRKIINQTRGEGIGANPAPTPAQRRKMAKEQDLLSLPEIVVKIPKLPSKKKKHKGSIEHWVIGSDFHAPYQHEPSCSIFYQVIQDLNPDRVILLGDVLTLDAFARFDKTDEERIWINDISESGKILGNVKQAAPDARLQWFKGNHEDRLRKYLIRKGCALQTSLDLEGLFKITDTDGVLQDWEYVDAWEEIHKDLKLVLSHGTRVRKHAGMTGFSHLDDLLMSVIVGHCHRLGLYSRSSGRSRYLGEQPMFAIENGCMCEYEMGYTESKTMNWQHGFSVLAIDRSGEFPHIEPSIVSINNGKTVFRGKVYKG